MEANSENKNTIFWHLSLCVGLTRKMTVNRYRHFNLNMIMKWRLAKMCYVKIMEAYFVEFTKRTFKIII